MSTRGAVAPEAAEGSPGAWRRAWASVEERLQLERLAYPVPRHANRLGYILGGTSLAGMVILLVTGIWLAQFYNPDPDHAHDSVSYITSTAQLGSIVRGVHFWTGNFVVILVMLHMGRVFVTGSYKRPREFNWLVGLVLLVITIAFSFTGTVLKWDQEAFEALGHNTEIGNLIGAIGGWFSPEFTHSTSILARIYIAHVAILPFALVLVLIVHFFQIRTHGISPLPSEHDRALGGGPEPDKTGSTFSHHIARMALLGLGLLVLTLVLTPIWAPAFGPPPDPDIEVTKPPWPFLPLYPFESWFGITALLWVPVILFLVLAAVPFVDRSRFMSIRRRLVFGVLGAVLVLGLVGLGVYAWLGPVVKHMEEAAGM
ncbi:MAG TPA: cytochrome b N-terminal domain-containing protein [Candidatus Eisenbacteria bacterium]|nr:cytochrome b N-terminal domain-containing protein [Candidatus Eisenbacteria bacterium]